MGLELAVVVPVEADSMVRLCPCPDIPEVGHVDCYLVARLASTVFALAAAAVSALVM